MKKEVKEFCENNRITEDQFYGKEKVGGDLWLRGLTCVPENFNPTVGGDLLPILKKKNAYGLSRFESLVSF
jgi:hypothetical protein